MGIATPCINICMLDARSGLCEGCGRSSDEIGAWASLSQAERRYIMAQLPERLARLNADSASREG
jgi:predicted Fe-S protein YdhL (DUF1289 family)